MAQNKVVLDVEANTGSLRKEYREAYNELVRLQNSATATADEIARAAKKAADLKDRMADAASTVEAFNPDQKFKAFGQALSGVAGAFAAAQGAMALFGVESENVQKQLLKVQGALALSEGLNTILDSVEGFKNLGRVIRDVVVTSFTTLRGAIMATGVGALAVAIGYLIGNWDSLTSKLLKSFPVLNTIAEKIGKITNLITDFVGITKQADRDYEKSNEIFTKRKTIIEGQIEVLEAQGKKEKEIYNLKKDLANLEIADLENKKKTTSGLTKDEIKTLAEKYNQLKVLDAGFKKYMADKAKEDADARKKREDDAAEKEQERYKQIGETQMANYKKMSEERLQTRYDELQVEIDTLDRSNAIRENDYKEDLKRLEQSKVNLLAQREIELMMVSNVEDAELKKLEIKKKYADAIFNLDQKETDTLKAQEEARYNVKMKYAQLGMQLGQFLQDAAGQNKDLAIAGIILEQASAVASITISTIKNAAKAGFLTPTGIAEIAAGAIGVASAILAAKNGIDNINKINIPGSSSGSASISNNAPVMPTFLPPQATMLDSESMNTIHNVVSRAYVVESDISNSQNRVRRIQNAARF